MSYMRKDSLFAINLETWQVVIIRYSRNNVAIYDQLCLPKGCRNWYISLFGSASLPIQLEATLTRASKRLSLL